MAKKFLTAIDLNKNEIIAGVVQNLASAPGSPVKGQLYFNSTGGDNTLYWYDGTGWVAAKAPSTSGITQGEGDARYVPLTRNVTTTAPLAGGSTLAGDLTLSMPAATTAATGHTRLATTGEATSQSLTNVAVTPAGLADRVSTGRTITTTAPLTIGGGASADLSANRTMAITAASETATGIVELATAAEATAQTDNTRAVTPLGLADRVKKTGDTMSGGLTISTGALTLNTNPANPLEAATKQYVDNLTAGLAWKDSVRTASIANAAIASGYQNGSVVDGITLATGDRILIKSQTTTTENGIYTVNASGTPTRATDADALGELDGAAVFVNEGTTMADTAWVCTTNPPITPGTTGTAWAQFGAGATYTAGGGLTLTAQTLAVGQGTGITVNADDVALATGGTANSHLATMAANTVKMNNTAGTASPTDVTVANVKTALGVPSALPVPVADGGTGRATGTTANSLVATGTTPTGVQVTVANGTSGWFLKSAGTSIPAFTAIATADVTGLDTALTARTRKYTNAAVGGATSQVLNHALGTRDVIVDVYRTLTPWDTVECDVERTDANNITVRFAVPPAASEYTAVVIG